MSLGSELDSCRNKTDFEASSVPHLRSGLSGSVRKQDTCCIFTLNNIRMWSLKKRSVFGRIWINGRRLILKITGLSFTRRWSTVGLSKPNLLWSMSLHTSEPSWEHVREQFSWLWWKMEIDKCCTQDRYLATYFLWMLTTQLPSVPRTWCPPTILVFMCTKHDILGLVTSKHGDIYDAAC